MNTIKIFLFVNCSYLLKYNAYGMSKRKKVVHQQKAGETRGKVSLTRRKRFKNLISS